MNDRSAVAAKDSTSGEFTSSQMLHAQDYLVYGYLQKADEENALKVMRGASVLDGPWDKNARGAAAYALAAMPARVALEKRDWTSAASLTPRQPETFPWSEEFAAFEAIAWFARGLGSARDGQNETAIDSVTELQQLKSGLEESGQAYWAMQLEIQIHCIQAWNTYTQGDADSGLKLMAKAAALESRTFKHPITPGELLPASELYGDMLLDAGNAEGALEAYRKSMNRSPGRFNSLYGAAMAADALGDTETAAAYFASIVEMTDGSDADWPRLIAAREHAK